MTHTAPTDLPWGSALVTIDGNEWYCLIVEYHNNGTERVRLLEAVGAWPVGHEIVVSEENVVEVHTTWPAPHAADMVAA